MVQVWKSAHRWHLYPQAAQNLTPSAETVKYVWLGQRQEPSPLGVAKATQDEQTEAEVQMAHPEVQGTQVLLASG